ncbi:MAG: 30S ribosomal protein S9 [Patescibacteria group bacterium]
MVEKSQLYGLGRRKTAIAKVVLVPDAEERTVNGQPFLNYFPTISMQQRALLPLNVTSQEAKFGFQVKVVGGGKHGQADAVRLGIARALLKVDEGWRKQLRASGLLTRDPRAKERKKPGLKRARRAPQFSKR